MEDLVIPDESLSVEARAIMKDEIARVRKVIQKLEEPYKDVFILHIFGEVKLVEIASIYGKSESWAKMRLPCKIVEDLMPLYEEGICSEETKEAVGEHLRECEKCRELFSGVKEMPAVSFKTEKPVEEKALMKGLKKSECAGLPQLS